MSAFDARTALVPPEEDRRGEVAGAVERLEAQSESIGRATEILAARIDSVLSPHLNEVKEVREQPVPIRCGLATKLEQISDRLELFVAYLDELRRRIEL